MSFPRERTNAAATPVPDHIRITDKQRVFCDEYMVDRNGVRAATVAGYAVPSVSASKLQNPKLYPLVAAYLKHLMEKQDGERLLRKNFIREQLHRMVARDVIGFEKDGVVVASLADIPSDLRRCVDGFKVRQRIDPKTGAVAEQTIDVKLSPLASAVDMAAKMRGMYAKDNAQKPGANVTVVNWEPLYAGGGEEDGEDALEKRIERERGELRGATGGGQSRLTDEEVESGRA